MPDARLIPLRPVHHDAGLSWVAAVPDFAAADGPDDGRVSTLKLFENGRELGPGHATHADIRELGGGRYSHWQSEGNAPVIYFSSSDGSPPSTNGRSYLAVLEPAPLPEPAPQPVVTASPEAPNFPQHRAPVFVIGCPRSGTTLLFELLRAHPDLVPTTGYPDGEDHVGWVEHGGALLSGTGLSRDGSGPSGGILGLSMDERDIEHEAAAAMHAHYRRISEAVGGGRVVNKCPPLINKLRWVRAIFPDARFVHIVREPEPVVASWMEILAELPDVVLYWPDEALPAVWALPAPSGDPHRRLAHHDRFYPGGGAHRLAEHWATTNRNVVAQLADAPEQLFTLRFESLCADPEGTLADIWRFLELSEPNAPPAVRIKPRRNNRPTRQLEPAFRTRVEELTWRTRAMFYPPHPR